MFQAVGHELAGDYLDLTFRDTSAWTKAGPDIDIPNQWLTVGDPDCGPTIMLGTPPALPQDLWMPTHYHASDQFRAVIKGEYLLQTHRMKAGDFGYQVSGRNYREGLGGDAGECWIFAMHGTWPGARGTKTRDDGTFPLTELFDNQLDRFVDSPEDAYWDNVVGGARGIAAVNTTLNSTGAIYEWGSFDQTEDWRPLGEDVVATAGVFGLADSGPILFTIHARGDRVVMPSAVYGTETVCAVIRGSVEIGGNRYDTGDLRVQKAGVALDAVVSGTEGVDMVFVVGDRRERPFGVAADAASQSWKGCVDAMYSELCGV
jgi:hypothetical protein